MAQMRLRTPNQNDESLPLDIGEDSWAEGSCYSCKMPDRIPLRKRSELDDREWPLDDPPPVPVAAARARRGNAHRDVVDLAQCAECAPTFRHAERARAQRTVGALQRHGRRHRHYRRWFCLGVALE